MIRFENKIKFGDRKFNSTFAKKVMEIPSIYDESEALLIVASFKDTARADIISPKRELSTATDKEVEETMRLLTVSLISLLEDEVKKNRVGKTYPLMNLCVYMAQYFPELVIEDELYKIRRALLEVVTALEDNEDAHTVRNAFLELKIKNSGRQYQLQILAVEKEEDKIDFSTIKVYSDE